MHSVNDFLNDDGYTPSISNQTTSLRSTLEDHSLSTYCTSTREPVLDKMLYNRQFHDVFTWLKLHSWHLFRIVFTCVSSSDATTEDHNSCAHHSISFQTYCHRVCLITRVLELDILFTSANVKTILAGVVFTSDVKTLRIDLDPTSQPWTLQTTQSQCSTCWSRPHLGNSLPHLRLRQLSFFSSITMFSNIYRSIPRHLGNLLVHVLLQLLHCRASLGTTTVDFTLFTRSFTCCVRTGGPSPPPARCV